MNDSTFETDVRVRERNRKRGQYDPKDNEKHLKDLPDVASKAETMTIPQPALGGGRVRE